MTVPQRSGAPAERTAATPDGADAAVPDEPAVPDALALAAGFPATDRAEWRRLVAGVLTKAGRTDLPDPVEDALRRTVATGVRVAPLYTAEDAGDLPTAVGLPGLAPYVRGAHAGRAAAEGVPAGWDVRQRHAHPDPATTNAAVLADLENGATSLWLVLGDGGLPVDALPRALDGVLLDLAPVGVSGGPAAAEALLALLEPLGDGVAPGGSLGLDPLGLRAATGEPQDLGGLAALARRAAAVPGLRAVVVDGTVFADAGATAVEELGCALAAGVGYLRALTDPADGGPGLDVDTAFAQVEFRFAATADQFTTIAALRAARRLWDRVGAECGAAPGIRAMRQHAVTSSVLLTRHDPWVNLLRGTVACFAAGTGGADVVTVQPFDAVLGLPDAFSRRIARNTQSLLLEEASLGRVLDPAGGSWYVECLTEDLAQAAWSWFTEIERAGGLAAALDSGLVAERIGEAWQQRAARLAHRSDVVTGVSEFPDPAEVLPEREPAPEPPRGTGGLPRVRAAAPFEELRDRAEARDPRPAVVLATLGPPARHTARASFAANLLQAGGLATPTAEGAGALADTGTSVACICGSDRDYAGDGGSDGAAALAAQLREAGAAAVWLAGRPDLAVDGVDGYLYAGCDALAVLRTVHEQLGVSA